MAGVEPAMMAYRRLPIGAPLLDMRCDSAYRHDTLLLFLQQHLAIRNDRILNLIIDGLELHCII